MSIFFFFFHKKHSRQSWSIESIHFIDHRATSSILKRLVENYHIVAVETRELLPGDNFQGGSSTSTLYVLSFVQQTIMKHDRPGGGSQRGTLWICRVKLLLLLLPVLSRAAHSRRRIVITREKETYDRVITDFSPDGRLSQVEYAMEAARRGSTVAAATTDSGICLVIHNSSFGKVHRIDHHIWLATAGLSGDARFLASHLRNSCQQHRLDYGEAPTTEQVARMAGQFQHYLTRSGGVRPLGCTALVLGMDPVADEEPYLGRPKVFQADPGGVVEACTTHCAAGKGCDVMMKELGSIVSDTSLSTAALSQWASNTAQRVLAKLDDPKKVDVWTFEPRQGKRGGIQASCYRLIDKDSLSKIGDRESQ